jgi:hypothetical protein
MNTKPAVTRNMLSPGNVELSATVKATEYVVSVEQTTSGFYVVAFMVLRGERVCARSFDARTLKTLAGAERAATAWLQSRT